MRVIRARNVNDAFYEGMHLLDEVGAQESSRAGSVLVVPCPVTTVTERPTERVLFDPRRDTNPFFHLMEGLWMLAGRDDAAYLDRYVADFGSRFAESASGNVGAEPGGHVHGAYGHRWRSALGFDQLDAIVDKLRANPGDRQCVLQMWDGSRVAPTYGDNVGRNDLLGDWKDRPCNTHVYFRVRQTEREKVLDITVCCRSNDAIWGAHGANAVHFSMLQEYVAGRVGVATGTMHQVSNNYHVYEDSFKKLGDVSDLTTADPYESEQVTTTPMATDWSMWDNDLRHFMKWHDEVLPMERPHPWDRIVNTWFIETASRVALARWQWTHAQKHSAMKTAEGISAPDWRRACVEWMQRRNRS